MKKIKSLSEKRLIVTAQLNGKDANFLIDTGATVALVSERIKKEYGLIVGKKFPGMLVGAGGNFNAYYCNTPAYIEGKPLTQFLLTNIGNIVDSIKRETGIEIQGIISLPQMQFVGMQIDANDHLIILE